MKLIHADTRVVFYRYIYDVLSSRRREAVYGYIPRTSENLGDACGELHHNAEEVKEDEEKKSM